MSLKEQKLLQERKLQEKKLKQDQEQEEEQKENEKQKTESQQKLKKTTTQNEVDRPTTSAQSRNNTQNKLNTDNNSSDDQPSTSKEAAGTDMTCVKCSRCSYTPCTCLTPHQPERGLSSNDENVKIYPLFSPNGTIVGWKAVETLEDGKEISYSTHPPKTEPNACDPEIIDYGPNVKFVITHNVVPLDTGKNGENGDDDDDNDNDGKTVACNFEKCAELLEEYEEPPKKRTFIKKVITCNWQKYEDRPETDTRNMRISLKRCQDMCAAALFKIQEQQGETIHAQNVQMRKNTKSKMSKKHPAVEYNYYFHSKECPDKKKDEE